MSAPRLPDSLRRLPIAHRALHDARQRRPENSLSAIHAAISAGYAIEIDLQISSDGHAVMFHDETLDRMTAQSGPVNARSLADLRAIALKGSDDTIPSFAEVLSFVAGRVPILVDVNQASNASQ